MADQSQNDNSILEPSEGPETSTEAAQTEAANRPNQAAPSAGSVASSSRPPRRRTRPTVDAAESEASDSAAALTADDSVAGASTKVEQSAPDQRSAQAAPSGASEPSAQADDLPRPPSGRRSKTRPAGPPADLEAKQSASSKAAASADEPESTTTAATATDQQRDEQPLDEAVKNAVDHQNHSADQQQDQPTPVTDDEAADQSVSAAIKAVPKRTRSRSGQRKAAEQLLGDVPTDANGEVDKAAALQSLAAAIAGGPAVGGQEASEQDDAEPAVTDEPASANQSASSNESSDSEPSEDADEQTAEADSNGSEQSDQPSASRRRRRRGGRRRRRSGSSQGSADGDDANEADDDADDEAESPDAADSTSAQDDQQATSENASDDSDAQPEQGEASSEGVRRRRRRRRSSSDSNDDPDVVVQVREPRPRPSSGDEVTGIEGSTRLEAKRQRRKEGRAAGRSRAPILTEAEFLARRESVNRKMIVRQTPDYTQIAVLEDDILVEHYVDRDSSASAIGNVYLGKVQNVLPSMEAVFVDIGRGRNAVLYAGEVNWDAFEVADDHRKVEEVFKSGQSVIVQVSKDSVGAKGARLTGHVSIPGRFVVYSPDGHLSGISRKLPDVERTRLKSVLDEVVGDRGSVIVRTAAEGASEDELIKDVERLKAHWEVIERKAKQGGAPAQLYAEPDLTLRTIRDVFTEDFNELIVAGVPGANDVFDNIDQYVQTVAPSLHDRLTRWDSESQGDPFEKYRIDEQISKALERKVFLPSGGSLVIDRTEAMTVIDVNTGKFTGTGGNLEETVTRNNLEAAEEIVRQLRLRDLGGIVVIDFIDMVLPSNRELLLRRLVECLGRDRTRHQVSEVTSLGLVQLTRKRIGTGLAEAFTEECQTCGGRGFIRHEHPVATQAPADGGERNGHGSNSNKRSGGKSSNGKSSNGKSTPKKSPARKKTDSSPQQADDNKAESAGADGQEA